MPATTIFQSIPAYKPAATVRIIKSLNHHCKIFLDIEDSIQHLQNPALTHELKVKAREDFEEIIQNAPDTKFSLRVNAVNSKEFQYDKILLKKFEHKIDSVFIPKIESSNDIDFFYKET